MRFTPKDESEIKRFEPLPEGDYPFTVLASKEQESKSEKNKGRIMCAVKLAVHGPNGRDAHVYDYFSDWFSEWKLKHFAETTGHGESYEHGELDVTNDQAQGWTGFVRVFIEESIYNGVKQVRNAVDDYIPPEAKSVVAGQETAKAGFSKLKSAVESAGAEKSPFSNEDDVPF